MSRATRKKNYEIDHLLHGHRRLPVFGSVRLRRREREFGIDHGDSGSLNRRERHTRDRSQRDPGIGRKLAGRHSGHQPVPRRWPLCVIVHTDRRHRQ